MLIIFKLLRVLETGTFIKVGDTKLIKVDVRIISATNRDLSKEANEGHFRSDLFYRLSVFQIALPPLRERKADIEVMARFFAKDFAKKFNISIADLQEDFLTKLTNYDWQGNIRELRNVIERTIILNENGHLTVESLPINIQFPAENLSANLLNSFDLHTIEKQHIQKVLQHTKGNKTETARLLNIGLTTLYRKIEEYNIS